MTKKLKPVVREMADKQRVERGHYRLGDEHLKFPRLTRNMSPMELEIFWEGHLRHRDHAKKVKRG